MFATNRKGVPSASAKSRKPKKDESASVTNIKSAAASTPATSICINGIDIHCEFKTLLSGCENNWSKADPASKVVANRPRSEPRTQL